MHFLSTRRRYRCRNFIIPLSCKTMIACRNESVFRDIQLPTRRYSPRASNSEKNERRRAARAVAARVSAVENAAFIITCKFASGPTDLSQLKA